MQSLKSYTLLFLVVLSPVFVLGQIAKQPSSFVKIIFSYQKTPKYSYDTKNFFCDSLTLKQDFPRFKNSFDASKKMCSVSFDALTESEKSKLMRILYNNTETIQGIYDVKKNKTVLKHVRNDMNLSLLFKSVFATDYAYLDFDVVYDYDKNLEFYNFPKEKSKKPIIGNRKMLTWLYADVNTATFIEDATSSLKRSLVTIDVDLNQYVNPMPLFDNCSFGVVKLETSTSIMTLETVKFE